MRRFNPGAPLNTDVHYYTPREELIVNICHRLTGQDPENKGTFFTMLAPAQSGKSWLLEQTFLRLHTFPNLDTIIIDLGNLEGSGNGKENSEDILSLTARHIGRELQKDFPKIDGPRAFQELFKKENLDKPLVLMLDDPGSLPPATIETLEKVFQNIDNQLREDRDSYHLQGVLLAGDDGLREILDDKDSPFDGAHGLLLPNLTYEEVRDMFLWYEAETGGRVEPEVVERLYGETGGQPGQTSEYAKALTEGCESCTGCGSNQSPRITLESFHKIKAARTHP